MRFIALLLVTANAGCFHRMSHDLRIGEEVIPPAGLDSVGTVKWVSEQRSRCRGELHFNVDHMPTFSVDGSPAPYQSGIISVVCARP